MEIKVVNADKMQHYKLHETHEITDEYRDPRINGDAIQNFKQKFVQ